MTSDPSSLRAVPTVFRVAFTKASVYRTEAILMMVVTCMPLIMLPFWAAVGAEQRMGRFGQAEFIGYFLITFLVRQLTGSSIAFRMNFAIRDGTLTSQLIRPFHPLLAFSIDSLCGMPARIFFAFPLIALAVLLWAPGVPTREPLMYLAFLLSTLGACALTLIINLLIGCMAFFIQTAYLMNFYLAASFVLSGYVVPVELLPDGVRRVGEWLPFRYQIGLPVEIATGAYDHAGTLAFQRVGFQWLYVAAFLIALRPLWNAGLRRFDAYGA